MPKALTPTQALEQKIKDIEAAIADKERQFLAQSEENSQFAEALKILNSGTAAYIPVGRILLLDKINALLNEASDKADREYRLQVTRQALVEGQVAAASFQAEIEQLRQQLAIAQSELDWMENYQPHVERYRAGFLQPSPEDVKNGKVAAFEADINQRRTHLLRAQAWLS
ncbi:hypothetical protein, partial [Tolypothrix sp. VBCCA 56010]|uniref:hypothetical protein n=1 Tax=Tolypothrix sp. VBCCA 56010 TaxID=3137731 RepID=UPI003D7CBF57